MMKIKKILLAANYQYEFYAPAWARGLEKLGVEVVPFDWNKLWSGGITQYFEKRFLLGPAIDRINSNLLKAADNVKPDVVIIYKGLPIRPKTVKTLSQKYWVTGYCNDDPFGRYARKAFYRWLKKGIPYYTSHHVYREKNIEEYKRTGAKFVSLLMPYYCPWLNHPIAERETEGHPVVFVGNAEPQRSKYISYLVENGIPIKVFGPGDYWRRYLRRNIYKRLSPIKLIFADEYSAALSWSRISLAFLNPGNNDQYTRRMFEIPACKGFLLAQRTPVMKRLYTEGKEAEYFESKEELKDKIKYYLSHEDERQKIAEAGYKRCISSGYDIYSRMEQWLKDTESWMRL